MLYLARCHVDPDNYFYHSPITQEPVITVIAPGATDSVEGTITLIGTVSDDGVVEAVEISDDGVVYATVNGTHTFSIDLDLASYETPPQAFVLRATDRSGNGTDLSVPLAIDQESDRPIAEIQIPEEGAVLTRDFVVSGMAFDDDGVRSVVYRLDDGDPITLEIDNSFVIPVSLSSIADNEHSMTV